MTPTYVSGSTHFTVGELQCHCGCGLLAFHPGFINKLEELRLRFNRGMIVTSAARCAKYNAEVGGHPHSLHVADKPFHATKGQVACLAIDIRAEGFYRGDLQHVAWECGWSVGEGKGFLHLDWRITIGFPQTTFSY